MMLEDYQDAVLAAYKKKKDSGQLSITLSNPTTANLKQECLNTHNRSPEPKDVDALATFFDLDKIGTEFSRSISNADPGAFRPLLNHLNGETGKTNIRNSELLAWLIDFELRPSTRYYNALREFAGAEKRKESDRSDTSLPRTAEGGDKPAAPTTIPSPKTTVGISKKIVIILCIAILIVARVVIYFWDSKVNQIRMPLPDEKCMYWTGSHYEPVKCNTYIAGATIVPLDIERLKNQRKIPAVEPVSKTQLKRAWYAKVDGEPELYSDSGVHPIDTTKKLRPLSQYMINKYDLDERFFQKHLNRAYYITLAFLVCWLFVIVLKEKRQNTQRV
ncbi:hypothetical protein [Pedobacter endophyticus]|uniref:Uncharacterized protein n=1 Tax=Pedobacter endophyticus TaxID=2789740 RepID=A0A7U3Q3G1_9SPHI|nr:hypothetical protein [Pedobacter endophyticus]QPH37839.1 hypothetical protein IZT61_12025 [Pedobacter endophyticus]